MSKELDALEVMFENEFYDITEEYNLIKQALTELEELKRDVKRFNELRATFRCAPETLSVDDIKEYEVLSDKIWKVGKEE